MDRATKEHLMDSEYVYFRDLYRDGNRAVEVSVNSYDGGRVGLKLIRLKFNDSAPDRPFYQKLGRLSAKETKGIMPLMRRALEYMD